MEHGAFPQETPRITVILKALHTMPSQSQQERTSLPYFRTQFLFFMLGNADTLALALWQSTLPVSPHQVG